MYSRIIGCVPKSQSSHVPPVLLRSDSNQRPRVNFIHSLVGDWCGKVTDKCLVSTFLLHHDLTLDFFCRQRLALRSPPSRLLTTHHHLTWP